MTRVIVQLLMVVAVVVATRPTGGGAAPPAPRTNAAACSTIGGTPRRLELPDGRIISIDVRSVARSDGWTFAAGRHAYLFPRDARSRTSPLLVDSLLGVAIDGRGEVSLVRNPLLPRRAFHPRVATAPNGSFHVLFATGLDTIVWAPQPTDTVTLWYATYTRGWWSRPARVGHFPGGVLDPELSSALLVHNGELSIAFPFRDNRSDSSWGGAIMLQRRRGRWYADTLRTWRTPPAIHAVHDVDGTIVTSISLDEPGEDNYRERWFVARYDSGWGRPTHVGGNGLRHITTSTLRRTESDFIVSWVDWPFGRSDSAQLHWVRVDRGLRPHTQPIVDSTPATFPFELVVIDDRHPMWMYHDQPFGGSVNLMVNIDSTIREIAPLVAPFTSPLPLTLPLSANRFLVFTQKRAAHDNEPMAASFMTPLEVRCPKEG